MRKEYFYLEVKIFINFVNKNYIRFYILQDKFWHVVLKRQQIDGFMLYILERYILILLKMNVESYKIIIKLNAFLKNFLYKN